MSDPNVVRVGCVSYLNARPLVWGLEEAPLIRMIYVVPAELLSLLATARCDVALLPAIDYQRMDDLVVVPGSCIGANGHVHTVRLFSRVPINSIHRLYADVESHTSVVLCRILLKEVYRIEPEFVADEKADVDARLLIGDKVVCHPPEDHPWQIDLAQEWKHYTGLPFVFAAWMARRDARLADLPARLEAAMGEGLKHIDEIVQRDAIPRGWPPAIAADYLARMLKFPIDLRPQSPQRRALELFHQKAHEMGLTPQCRKLEVWGGSV